LPGLKRSADALALLAEVMRASPALVYFTADARLERETHVPLACAASVIS